MGWAEPWGAASWSSLGPAGDGQAKQSRAEAVARSRGSQEKETEPWVVVLGFVLWGGAAYGGAPDSRDKFKR